MEEWKLDNYVITPRYIKSDYYEGKLTRPERNLLLWLRVCGDPYGIAVVTLDGMASDTFNQSCDKSYINRLLLSLKRKRYVWYSERTGRRGSFEVHMGDWILPSKQIKRLERYFDDNAVRGADDEVVIQEAEVEPELTSSSQRFPEVKSVANTNSKMKEIGDMLRGYDKDNNKEKEKENKSLKQSLSINEKRDYGFGGFKVNSYEEQRCKEIAQAVGDKDVAYCIGIYRKHGLNVLEEAYMEFKSSFGKDKDHPPSFFNALVQQVINP